MKRLALAAFGVLGVCALGQAKADDLTGVDRFICSTGPVSACCDSGECATGQAAELGVPQFLEFDVKQKRISSTKASGLNRTTPIDTVKRENGNLVMQGVENGRAFSFVVDEKDGTLSAAVAVVDAGCTLTGFAWCTPLAGGK
jgi:hypothetical protein